VTKVRALAHPSLALIKYWGKQESGINLPAVPSLALTLEGLTTTTTVSLVENDQIVLNGKAVSDPKVIEFLERIRQLTHSSYHFLVESTNDFPTAAGLASSSSGFAALAAALWALIHHDEPKPKNLSEWARLGSGSASRSVFGGWTLWPAGAEFAEQLYGPDHWTEVRVILFVLESGPKPLGSREAMNLTRQTSPYYPAWVSDSPQLLQRALEALNTKAWKKLGEVLRLSYLRMFATMYAADPPIIYWLPESLQLIRLAEELRQNGLSVFETMDAGPQVKYFCREEELPRVLQAVAERVGQLDYRVAKPGGGVRIEACPD